MINLNSISRRLLVLAGFFWTTLLPAQLVITNWNISGNTVSFDISGQFESSVTFGGNGDNSLYIGDPGNTAWVTASGSTGTLTNSGSGSADFETSGFGYQANSGSPGDGDYIYIAKSGYNSWSKSDSVGGTVTISGGTLNGSAIDPENLIVTVGFYYSSGESYNDFPNIEHQVGYGVASAVPEPSSYAAIVGGLALGLVGSRRRRKPAPPTSLT